MSALFFLAFAIYVIHDATGSWVAPLSIVGGALGFTLLLARFGDYLNSKLYPID